MIWALVLACTPPAPDAPVKVRFKPGATVADLVRFTNATLCERWEVPAASGKRTLKLSVEGEVPGKQVAALVRLLGDSAGLAAAAEGTSTRCNPALASAIIPVDPWTRKVPASARDQLLECGPAQVRIVPHFKDGVAQGITLFGIRQGSVLEALAFQNGDVVLSVNGAELSTPDQALSAYAKLKGAAELKFAVLRKSEPRTITWLVK